MCYNKGVTTDLSFYTGKFHCLVQLSTLPVTVCEGSGTYLEEAQARAVQNALEYL